MTRTRARRSSTPKKRKAQEDVSDAVETSSSEDEYRTPNIKRTEASSSTGHSSKSQRKKPTRRSDRAGLSFPVGRIHRQLRKFPSSRRISATAPVYMAAVLEYLVAEVLELAVDEAAKQKRRRITPKHIETAVRLDSELADVWKEVTIPDCGAGGASKFYPQPADPPKRKTPK